MPQKHIVSIFDEELNTLRSKIVQMGNLVDKQFEKAAIALKSKDLELAKQIREGDREIDAIEQEIEKHAINMIALRSPVADDLREIISAIKISNGLERIGDYAKNLAKRIKVLSHSKTISVSSGLIDQMIFLLRGMITEVIEAYVNQDAEKAIEIWNRDQEVDSINNSLFRELLTYMMENPKLITPATHLMFIAKNIERAGDHVTNIAELIYYIDQGEQLELKRPKKDSSSYTEINFDPKEV